MRLTFRGFLKRYVKELFEASDMKLSGLVSAANEDCPQGREALFLYALECGRLDDLLRLSEGTRMEGEWALLEARARESGGAETFSSREDVPERYRKVLAAYRWQSQGRSANREETKVLLRERILEALHESGMSVYRLCKDLNLNQGNVYAFLNGGDLSKVGYDLACRMGRELGVI